MSDDPRSLLQQADKAAASAGSGFGWFGSKTDKYENAVELYQRAASAFRLQKAGKEAGLAFERAATIQTEKLSEPDDAANTLLEAFKVYRKTDPEDAARVLEKTIRHFTTKGNFRRAATNQMQLAELYELEIGDAKRALPAYEDAASWFESDNAEALSNKACIKVAELAAEEGEYQKATENFEQVAKKSMNNNLTKYSVKDYLFKAGIVHLASGDMVAMQRALEDNYPQIDNSFPTTREYKLLQALTAAVEQGDQETFSDQLYQFDQMSKLDKWKTKLLLKVKEGIEEQGEDFS